MVPEGFQRANGKPFVRPQAHTPVPERPDAPTTARLVGLPPMGRSHFSSMAKEKCKRKPAARRLQRRPAPLRVIRKYRRSGTAARLLFAQACQSLTAYGSCAHWALALLGPSFGLREPNGWTPRIYSGRPFRPLDRNSLTTFRGQTALRGCPRARGVRCRIAPYRSLCSPPTSLRVASGAARAPTGATLPFGTVRFPHPPGKPYIAHF